jgi:Na+-driven multidrug efflux pump
MEKCVGLTLIRAWVTKPDHLTKRFLIVLPVIVSLVLQRLFPVVDNKYFAMLGSEALYLHNIQYNFISLGQFIGLATYISCLVFWNRAEYQKMQGSILIKHIVLVGIFTFMLAIICMFFSSDILAYYQISEGYLPLANAYLKVGLCNMILQAIYGGLDGMLVGASKQKISMYIAGILVLGNIVFNHYIVHYFSYGLLSSKSIYLPVMMMGLTTTILMIIAVLISFWNVVKDIGFWVSISFSEIFTVWWSELGTYMLRGIVPFIYSYQMNLAISPFRVLTSYQLGLHITYIFCFPLMAAMQIAIRDASSATAVPLKMSSPPNWWNGFIYTGFIPTTILLVVGMIFSQFIISGIYGYEVPTDHRLLILMLFISSWIGQVGNMMTVPCA